MMKPEPDQLQKSINDKAQKFIVKLYTYGPLAMAFLGFALIIVDLVFQLAVEYLVVAGVIAAVSMTAMIVSRSGRAVSAGIIFLFGLSSVFLFSVYLSPYLRGEISAGLALMVVLCGFTLSSKVSTVLGCLNLIMFIIAISVSPYVESNAGLGGAQSGLLPLLVVPSGVIAIFTVAVHIVANHTKELRDLLSDRLRRIEVFVPKITESGNNLSAAAQEIHVLANQHTQGVTQQSAAVEEIRLSLQSLLAASVQISEAAQNVQRNADQTFRNSKNVADRIELLARQTHRISEIVETIRDIANKSELLALNAALEGTKAGEIGRGFSLVAAQMQKLTENVMKSLEGIKGITKDIRQDSDATQISMEAAIKLAEETTQAGREIALITQQQHTSTKQITNAMNDITIISKQVAEGSKLTLESTERLHEVAVQLPILLEDLKSNSDNNTTVAN